MSPFVDSNNVFQPGHQYQFYQYQFFITSTVAEPPILILQSFKTAFLFFDHNFIARLRSKHMVVSQKPGCACVSKSLQPLV